MNTTDFTAQVKEAFLTEFPKGWIRGGYGKQFTESVSFIYGIQPKEKWQNNIEHNDPARSSLFIWNVTDGEFDSKIEAELSMGNSLAVKPEEGSFMAYGSAKFGWRKKTAEPEKVLLHIKKYFKKMRKVVDENRDNMLHDID